MRSEIWRSDAPPTQPKRALEAELERDVQAYLQRGGRIHECASGVSGDLTGTAVLKKRATIRGVKAGLKARGL